MGAKVGILKVMEMEGDGSDVGSNVGKLLGDLDS